MYLQICKLALDITDHIWNDTMWFILESKLTHFAHCAISTLSLSVFPCFLVVCILHVFYLCIRSWFLSFYDSPIRKALGSVWEILGEWIIELMYTSIIQTIDIVRRAHYLM